jgi:enoyl-CoA hydratase
MAPREAQLVTREVGASVARAMLLEAAVFDAEQMLARGFLSGTVADGDVASEAMRRAKRIMQLAPQAARLNKQTLRTLQSSGLTEACLSGAYCYAPSPEHQEGIAAFLAKRQPDF